jgi:energy-coupling factor transporter ATP-binding protein EcfA2
MAKKFAVRRTVLVTGNPGSGKTTMVTELTRLGYTAVDADLEIAGWKRGPAGRRWMWDRSRLEMVIRGHAKAEPLFVCGIAMNQRDMLDLFDRVFLLSLDLRTQRDRLAASGDRDPAMWKPILEGLPVFEREMRAVGATVLDARLPAPLLAAHVIEGTGVGPSTAAGRPGNVR